MIDYTVTDPSIDIASLPDAWTARWISALDSASAPTGAYRFRTEFDLDEIPRQLLLRVSADNRYRLFVNGLEVGIGPGRNSLMQWKYETYDIAPLLHPGRNILAAMVWFVDQSLSAIAQLGYAPGFLVSAVDVSFSSQLDTPNNWRCQRATGHDFFEKDEFWTYCVVGPCERISGAAADRSWLTDVAADSGWLLPKAGFVGEPYGIRDAGGRHMLIPNRLPQPVREHRKTSRVVRSFGLVNTVSELTPQSPIRVPPGSKATILLDNATLTTSYPKLSLTGGKGSLVRQRYAEALNEPGHLEAKGNRDEVEGKIAAGYHDEFLPDGRDQVFEPLWYRTFRYIQLEVETAEEELTITAFNHDFTAYPFEEAARFESPDRSIGDIWDVGWRTARLCAFESYMDCPYYEQMQYVGDTRLQCLVSYYVSGDGRLARNAIAQIGDSLLPCGLTQSRFPSNLVQVIPPFSLWWIGMLHDYWMFQSDAKFVADHLSSSRFVLDWFISRLDESDTPLLGPLPFWNFVDWTDGFPHGVAPGANEGGCAVLTLQLVLTLREQADMEDVLGIASESARCNSLADKLISSVRDLCWNDKRGLIAETPAQQQFSQHTNALAILAGLFDKDTAREVALHILSDPADTLIQTGFYFRYYVHKALEKAGLGDGYLDWLDDWKEMLSCGLTTFAEKPDPVRSDCHAWSAHPLVGLLSIVLGVTPSKPGFSEVAINPHIGELAWAEGVIPHPAGQIAVRVEKNDGNLVVIHHLPPGVTLKAK